MLEIIGVFCNYYILGKKPMSFLNLNCKSVVACTKAWMKSIKIYMCVVIQKKRKRKEKEKEKMNIYSKEKKGVWKRKQKGSLDAYLK